MAARFNYPVQAAESEGLKEGLILLLEELQHYPAWKLVNVVHDSVMLEVPDSDTEQAQTILRECMEAGMSKLTSNVPPHVDVTVCARWDS